MEQERAAQYMWSEFPIRYTNPNPNDTTASIHSTRWKPPSHLVEVLRRQRRSDKSENTKESLFPTAHFHHQSTPCLRASPTSLKQINRLKRPLPTNIPSPLPHLALNHLLRRLKLIKHLRQRSQRFREREPEMVPMDR